MRKLASRTNLRLCPRQTVMRWILPVLSTALIAVGTYVAFSRSLTRARARLAGRSDMVETSFGAMEYAVMGEGEPVLSIHGAAGGFDQTLDMTGALAGRGYRLIAPSRFGYLRSSMPDHPTVAMQADAYAELLDRLGVHGAVVVGISAGAWSCLQFAIRHPGRCKALVLLVPASALPKGVRIRGGAFARAIFNSDFVAWVALKLTPILPGAMTKMMLGTDSAVLRKAEPSEKARVRQILDHLLPVSRRIAGMNFDVATAATPESCPLEKIACPVLTISAEDDTFGTAGQARSIAAGVPDGRAIIFPTGGHAMVGRHADALREITSFLQAMSPACRLEEQSV
jgi:2-hydroxy-6-oxonona-2,4-dienedioate hydrolase